MAKNWTSHVIKGLVESAPVGLVAFLSGIAVQVLAQASGIASVSSVPVSAIVPVFTIAGAGLGLMNGISHSLDDEDNNHNNNNK